MVSWTLSVFGHVELWLVLSPMGIEIATAFPQSDALPGGALRRCRHQAGNADWNPRDWNPGGCWDKAPLWQLWRVPSHVSVTHRSAHFVPLNIQTQIKGDPTPALGAFGLFFCANTESPWQEGAVSCLHLDLLISTFLFANINSANKSL